MSVRGAETADRILGIDPGTAVTGWGVVIGAGSQISRVASGVVRVRGERSDRLRRIHDAVRDLCAQFSPAALSLEQSFVGDNVQTAFRLGEARGAVMVAAAAAGVPVTEYAPAAIKVAVVGSGRADKRQMQVMVKHLLGLAEELVADEADALGAAICHLNTARFDDCVSAGRSIGGRGGTRRRVSRR